MAARKKKKSAITVQGALQLLAHIMDTVVITDNGHKVARNKENYETDTTEHIEYEGLFIIPKVTLVYDNAGGPVVGGLDHPKELEIELLKGTYNEFRADLDPSELADVYTPSALWDILHNLDMPNEDNDAVIDYLHDHQNIKLLPPDVVTRWMEKVRSAYQIWDKYRQMAPEITRKYRANPAIKKQRKKFKDSFVEFLVELGDDCPRMTPEFARQVFQLSPAFLHEAKKYASRSKFHIESLTTEEMKEIQDLAEVTRVQES